MKSRRRGIIIVFGLIACTSIASTSVEEKANQMYAECQALMSKNRRQAIELGQSIVIQFPTTNASKRLKQDLPMWRHLDVIDEIQSRLAGMSYSRKSVTDEVQKAISNDMLRSLIAVYEDYPDYTFRSALIAQIAALVFIREMMPVFMEIRDDTSKMEQRIHSRIDSIEDSDESFKTRLKYTAELQAELFSKISMAFSRASVLLRGFAEAHTIGPVFQSYCDVLLDYAKLMDKIVDLQEYAAREEVIDCLLQQFNLQKQSFFDRLIEGDNTSKCEYHWNRWLEERHEVDVEAVVIEGRFMEIGEEAELAYGAISLQFGQLQGMLKAIRKPQLLAMTGN